MKLIIEHRIKLDVHIHQQIQPNQQAIIDELANKLDAQSAALADAVADNTPPATP